MHLRPEQIQAWIVRNFPAHKTRKNEAEYRINNPFVPDNGYHLGISTTKGLVHDWRGDSWIRDGLKKNKCTFLKFVQLFKNCSYHQAIRDVLEASTGAQRYLSGQRIPEELERKEKQAVALPVGTEPFTFHDMSRLEREMLAYLTKRGIGKDKIQKYDIRYCTLDVVWPYYEYEQLVYWQTRSRIGKTFRFPPEGVGATKGQFLYGFDHVEPASYLVITEAIFDSITLGSQCVASGGATLTDTQVRKIRLLGPRDGIILAPDNDHAGFTSILSNLAKLCVLGYPLFYSVPPDPYKDWNEMLVSCGSESVVRKAFESAIKKLDDNAKIAISRVGTKKLGDKKSLPVSALQQLRPDKY